MWQGTGQRFLTYYFAKAETITECVTTFRRVCDHSTPDYRCLSLDAR